MSRIFTCIYAIFVSAPLMGGNCAPERMLHVVTAAQYPGVSADSFASQPKATYRYTNKYGRVEEAESPTEHLQLLIVVNEPDVWVVNRIRMTGNHMTDPGPTLNFRAPLIAQFSSERWNAFEFGCEESFMKGAGVQPVSDDSGNLQYTYEAEGRKAVLHLSRDHRPQRVEITTSKGTYAIKYLQYEWLEFDPRLFQRPGKVQYTEGK
jgi:hypothetical protein